MIMKYLDPKAEIPAELLNNPEIGKAVEDLNISGFTDAELRAYDKFWDSVSVEKTLQYDSFQEGMAQRSLEIAKKMLAKGMDEVMVREVTGLSADLIQHLKAEM